MTSYAAARRDDSGRVAPFTPYPATWFNQGRYHDDRSTWIPDNAGDAAAIIPHPDYLTLSDDAKRKYQACQKDGVVYWSPIGAALPPGYAAGSPKSKP